MYFNLHAVAIDQVRQRIDEPVAAAISNRFITSLLNLGAQNVAKEVYMIVDFFTYSTVANQQEYDLPADFIRCFRRSSPTVSWSPRLLGTSSCTSSRTM